MARFSEVLTIINGKNQRQVENPNGKYPIYGSGGIMGYADDYICDGETVIIGRKGNINKPIFVDSPFWNVDTAFGLSAKRGVLSPKYLYYFCETFDFEKLNTTVTIPSLTKANLLDIEIRLPSLTEQERIVALLDKLTHLISFRKQQLAKLDELVKARFVEMFGDLIANPMGWEFQKLSNLCDVRDGTHDSPVYQSEGYPLLTSKNFSSGIIDFSDCNLISKEDFEKINKRSKVDFGDIIMPMIGTIGHPVIVDTSRPFAIKNVALLKFSDKKISNIFLKNILDSDYFFKATAATNRGGTQKFIALGDIRNIPVPIVPMRIQIDFAVFAGEVSRQKLTIQQSLDKMEVLKKALMQEYFG